MAATTPSYYAVIPADIRYDTGLPPNAKLLYGEISALADATGACFAGNAYFADLYTLSDRTIRSLLRDLETGGYITTDVLRDPDTGQVTGRVIVLAQSQRKFSSTGGNFLPLASGKKFPPYIMFNNNISPQKPPQGGDPAPKPPRRSRESKSRADVLPKRFDGFWGFYRTHVPPGSNAGNRQKAIRAWDKLAPDDELATAMAKSLAIQVRTVNWQSGIGVPHASTWLNNRGWEDDWGELPDDQGTSDDEEVAEWD